MNRDTYEIRFEFEKESTPMFWAKEEYAFEKTEVWISKISEVRQTDNHMRLYQKPCARVNSGFEYFGVEKLEFKISHYVLTNFVFMI